VKLHDQAAYAPCERVKLSLSIALWHSTRANIPSCEMVGEPGFRCFASPVKARRSSRAAEIPAMGSGLTPLPRPFDYERRVGTRTLRGPAGHRFGKMSTLGGRQVDRRGT
jgi:hypothetical protein